MGFVEDHRSVIRQTLTELIPAYVEIREEQVVVDDHDVGCVRSGTHACNETRLVFRTLLPDTHVATSVYPIPKRKIFRKIDEFASISGLSFVRPPANGVELIHLIKAVENGLMLGLVNTIQASIVSAALHIRRRELLWQDLLQERNVLFHQLFLQILGAGRDDDPLFFFQCCRDRRDKIRECLASSCACLYDQVPRLSKCVRYRVGHLHLAFTIFVVFMRFCYCPGRAEHVFHHVRKSMVARDLYIDTLPRDL